MPFEPLREKRTSASGRCRAAAGFLMAVLWSGAWAQTAPAPSMPDTTAIASPQAAPAPANPAKADSPIPDTSAASTQDSILPLPAKAPTAADTAVSAGVGVPAEAQVEVPTAVQSPAGPSIEPPLESPAADSDPAGPDEIIVEVDPGQSRNRDKSLPLAMLMSVALPGAGEYYLREKGLAKAFLLAEAGFWASLYVGYIARDSYLQSARGYASEYAGIDASGKTSGFLETMASYRAYQEKQHRQDSYELAQILSGKRDRNYDIPPTEANYWDFGSSVNPENTDHWRTFQSTLRYYRASKVAISFAVGALALNRVASLANTLNVYKRTSARGIGLHIQPEFGPEYAATRVSLRF